jgi:hypothetical protein
MPVAEGTSILSGIRRLTWKCRREFPSEFAEQSETLMSLKRATREELEVLAISTSLLFDLVNFGLFPFDYFDGLKTRMHTFPIRGS